MEGTGTLLFGEGGGVLPRERHAGSPLGFCKAWLGPSGLMLRLEAGLLIAAAAEAAAAAVSFDSGNIWCTPPPPSPALTS